MSLYNYTLLISTDSAIPGDVLVEHVGYAIRTGLSESVKKVGVTLIETTILGDSGSTIHTAYEAESEAR